MHLLFHQQILVSRDECFLLILCDLLCTRTYILKQTALLLLIATHSPTPRGDPYVLLGTVYYDRNVNGQRDSNVDTPDFGNDVEYQFGLGGVTVQLYECDPQTNKAIYRSNTANNNNDNSNAMTTSLGYDSTYRPQLARKDADGGNWNMIDVKSDRSYL